MISYTPTPIQEIHDPLLARAGVKVLVKREDQNHSKVSGNKWWKLKHNLERARQEGHDTLLTFGGAYSNHLYAVAGAASELGLKSIGVVRGEETKPLNPTLSFAARMGMKLHHVSRAHYREKSDEMFTRELHNEFGDFYLIPEGGTNAEAVCGCREFGERLVMEVDFDVLCVPVGTGGTMAGLIQAMDETKQVLGFSVLKNGSFLEEEVQKWLPNTSSRSWRVETRFDFGGYAKSSPSLITFIDRLKNCNQLPLDRVYTGKALFGIYALIEQGEIQPGVVLMVHTGGLQGMS